MSRESRRAPPSLFPFLSTLVSAIGAITLVLIGAVLVVPTVDDEAEARVSEIFLLSEQDIAALRAQSRKLDRRLFLLRAKSAALSRRFIAPRST